MLSPGDLLFAARLGIWLTEYRQAMEDEALRGGKLRRALGVTSRRADFAQALLSPQGDCI